MSILRRMIEIYKNHKDPIGYARSIGVNVGGGCILAAPAYGSEPWLITIGNHVRVTSNVQFLTHDGGTWVITENERYKDVIKYGKIEIKDNCFIGIRATIMPGVTIGPNSVVGACSVVTKNVKPNTVVAGNPARVICTYEEYAEKCLYDTPPYDKSSYNRDKRTEVLRMLEQDKIELQKSGGCS